MTAARRRAEAAAARAFRASHLGWEFGSVRTERGLGLFCLAARRGHRVDYLQRTTQHTAGRHIAPRFTPEETTE